MSAAYPKLVAALLALSAILLSILVPGGPIETRSFAHIDPLILGAFNSFLTLLGMGSFVLVYFVIKNKAWALSAAAICAQAYFLVYLLDLLQIFPLSPDAMPRALFFIEIIGLIIALPLTSLAMLAQTQAKQENSDSGFKLTKPVQIGIAALSLLGLGIIAFATLSAMGK